MQAIPASEQAYAQCIQPCDQSINAQSQPGMHPVGRYIAEWVENEASLMNAGMRHDRIGRGSDEWAHRHDVQIQGASFIRLISCPPRGGFNLLQVREQSFWGYFPLQVRHAVHVIRLIARWDWGRPIPARQGAQPHTRQTIQSCRGFPATDKWRSAPIW